MTDADWEAIRAAGDADNSSHLPCRVCLAPTWWAWLWSYGGRCEGCFREALAEGDE